MIDCVVNQLFGGRINSKKDTRILYLSISNTTVPQKLKIGVIWYDGVVQPHSPVMRALKHLVSTLEDDGHTVMDWNTCLHKKLYDITNEIYFLDGDAEYYQRLDEGKKPAVPIIKWLLDEMAVRKYAVEGI